MTALPGFFMNMDTISNKLPKAERLNSKNIIDKLFAKSNSFVVYPLRVVYTELEEQEQKVPASLFVSVSKRKFRHAVDRNYMKRRIREAYRLNKSIHLPVIQEKGLHLAIAFIYLDKETREFENIDRKMKDALAQIATRISQPAQQVEQETAQQ